MARKKQENNLQKASSLIHFELSHVHVFLSQSFFEQQQKQK